MAAHPNSVISHLCLPACPQIADIYILSQPLMVRMMATEPPVINLEPGNFSLDIPASIMILTQPGNSTVQTIVSMDFVSLRTQHKGCLWVANPVPPWLMGHYRSEDRVMTVGIDVWREGGQHSLPPLIA